jgi:hypothetical protein
MAIGKEDIYNLIERLPDTEEEIRQLKSDSGYVTGEEAKREFGLQVDLP